MSALHCSWLFLSASEKCQEFISNNCFRFMNFFHDSLHWDGLERKITTAIGMSYKDLNTSLRGLNCFLVPVTMTDICESFSKHNLRIYMHMQFNCPFVFCYCNAISCYRTIIKHIFKRKFSISSFHRKARYSNYFNDGGQKLLLTK